MPKVGEQPAKGEKRLTPQQQKFLDNYIHKDMTQTAAARAAGYKNPNVSAVQLLNHPRVKERMEEMRQELESKYGVTITKSVRDMQRLRDEAWEAGNFSAARTAAGRALPLPPAADRLFPAESPRPVARRWPPDDSPADGPRTC